MGGRPADRGGADLRLADYRPRRMLRTAEYPDPPKRFPTIDAHNHLGHDFGGGWADRDAPGLAAALDAAGLTGLVDLDGGWGEHLAQEIDRWQSPLPGRVAVFAGLDYEMWAQEPAFGELEARRLRDGVAAGARGLKVWKTLGLHARDGRGRLVAVDDARLDPVWATAGEIGVPVTIHIADPIAFFEPLDESNERWEELHERPDWHVWPTRRAGRPDADGFPPFDALIDGLEAIVARHPATVFIGAHVGCAAEDLARVGSILERCPNFHVDIAARLAELGRQPYTARAFMVRWADRVLFGTDTAPDPRVSAVHRRFLETWDESFDYDAEGPPSQGRWQIHGLGLPDEVLRKVYADNARGLIRFGETPARRAGSPIHIPS
jgi:predicted TIM-barrel fold metal-dependent hydrolase